MIGELLGAAWEAVTLGELAIGLGLAGGGAGTVVVARWTVRTLQAGTRALEAVTRHLEASTAAARAGARLAPLAAETMRCYVREHRGELPPPDEEDSDQLKVLRVAAEGDDDELERAAETLAKLPPGATLPTHLARAVRRLVELEQEAQRRRAGRPGREEDVPRPRGRSGSWWGRGARS